MCGSSIGWSAAQAWRNFISERFSTSESFDEEKMSPLLHGTRSSVDDGPPPKRCACTGLNSRYDAIFELRKASTISPEASNSCGVKSILKRFDWARSASHEPRK